jgi:predicted ATPase/class 3 adenylate cyclase
MGASPEREAGAAVWEAARGALAFAFTDIEGSTQRWERYPEAMRDALSRHDALLRAAIVAHGGRVFKTMGDAFCAIFARPGDAVAALLEAQRALAAENFDAVGGLHVRMAVHNGSADERDGDYFGPTLNRVARLLAVGHGGQILISGATAALLDGALPPQAALRDLGLHRLKDLARPEHVFQVVAPGLAADFPQIRSLDVLPNNLPAMPTSFVGRDVEVAEIAALLDRHRLVTVVGAGGVGKTRTTLQVAANLLDGSGDGVWFVELAPLARGDYLPSSVAKTLGLMLPPGGDPYENLASALAGKRALLVLDNCEHLVESAASAIAAIVRGAPDVKILASSRQAIGIAGEATYRLPSLAVANSVALFAERAQAVDQRFALSDDNAATVADICRRLDGIPLAIELAAARVRILSPRQLRDRLGERFRLLTGGGRDQLPRQQTLRALIDWSYDLLEPHERALFRRLAVFAGSFSLDGAIAVASGTELDQYAAFDALAALVDKSMLSADTTGDAARYRLLESTRAYALEKLDAAAERESCARQHLRYLRERYGAIRERYERTGRHLEFEEAFALELDDLRAALDFALEGGEAVQGAALLGDVGAGWSRLGLDYEAVWRAERFIAVLSPGESAALARLWLVIGVVSGNIGQTKRALESNALAVSLARESGDAAILCEALLQQGASAARLQRLAEAQAALAEADGIPGIAPPLAMRLLGAKAMLSQRTGDYAAAAEAHERIREHQRALGNDSGERSALLNLAEVLHASGATARAIAVVRDVLAGLRAKPDRKVLCMVLLNLAGYLLASDAAVEALVAAREALGELEPAGPDAIFVAVALEAVSLAAALGGRFERAARLEGYADATFLASGFGRETTESVTYARLSKLLREHLAETELNRLLAEGAALAPEAAVALALTS